MASPLHRHKPHAMLHGKYWDFPQNAKSPEEMRKTFQDADFVIFLRGNVKKDVHARENEKFKSIWNVFREDGEKFLLLMFFCCILIYFANNYFLVSLTQIRWILPSRIILCTNKTVRKVQPWPINQLISLQCSRVGRFGSVLEAAQNDHAARRISLKWPRAKSLSCLDGSED